MSCWRKRKYDWRQRSRVSWLKAGDRNTAYFHRTATWRRKKNKIEKLVTDDGDATTDPIVMEKHATDFFRDIYTADHSVAPEIITNLFQCKVDDQTNESLCAPFTDEEISSALFQIGPSKAPGPDGFPAAFFQRNWGTIKEDIIRAVRIFFEEGDMPKGVNDTCIVLIPKVNNPTTLKDFQPISLCNVIYKVVAKCLVNRMRPLL
jgi:hypothetical protein